MAGTENQTLASIMSQRRAMSVELKNTNQYLQVALDNMARGVSMFDERQRLILCNKMYGELYGVPDELTQPGTPLSAIIRWYKRRETGREGAVDVTRQLEWISKEVDILAEGKPRIRTQLLFNGRTVRITTQPLPNGGWVDVQEDITEQRAAESALHLLAHRDPLTELPNRAEFRVRIEKALRVCGDETGFTVQIIDIGNFQSVKDRLGFAVREAFMQELARALVKSVSSPDLAARIDGELFAVLRPETTTDEADATEKLLESVFAEPFEVYGHQIEAAARIATVFAPRDGKGADQLISSGLQQLRLETLRAI
jgi:diguanylate cyclase (GGDEF)-like protein